MAENQSVQIQCLSIERFALLIVSFLQKICRLFFGSASGALRESFGKASGRLRMRFGKDTGMLMFSFCSASLLLRPPSNESRTRSYENHRGSRSIPGSSFRNPRSGPLPALPVYPGIRQLSPLFDRTLPFHSYLQPC